MKHTLLSFLIALAITAVLTPLAIWLAPKLGFMDVPRDERRMHKRAIPRFGGPGIYLGVLVPILLFVPHTRQVWGLLLGATVMLIIGLLDDRRGLRATVKLAGQILCAILCCIFDVRIFAVGGWVFPVWLSVLISIVWIVGITNTINLIDGLDGLAGGITCIACLSVAYTYRITLRAETELIVLAIAGAALGFLIYNMYPARIFMGDAGSMFFGFCLSTVSLVGENPTKGTTLFATLMPIVVLALPIFDTLFAIVRRAANHRPIMQADKGHIHHRIMALGFGQRRTVLALYCISGVMGIAGILWTRNLHLEALLLSLVAACLIVIFLGVGIIDKRNAHPCAPEAAELPAASDGAETPEAQPAPDLDKEEEA